MQKVKGEKTKDESERWAQMDWRKEGLDLNRDSYHDVFTIERYMKYAEKGHPSFAIGF